jgi:hypothetical protein
LRYNQILKKQNGSFSEPFFVMLFLLFNGYFDNAFLGFAHQVVIGIGEAVGAGEILIGIISEAPVLGNRNASVFGHRGYVELGI